MNGEHTYSPEDYTEMLKNMLPTGRAWTRKIESNLHKLFSVRGEGYHDVDERMQDLLNEAIPTLTDELLPDWERVAGLLAGELTTQERRNAVIAKLSTIGSLSKDFIIATALIAGFTITIREFWDFQVGRSTVGEPLTNGPWRYTFEVLDGGAAFKLTFKVGLNKVGEKLAVYGNVELQKLIARIKPANSIVVYNLYT